MTYTDTLGNTWKLNEAKDKLTTSNGGIIFIDPSACAESIPEMIEGLVNPQPIKSDAERIAELEAKLAALLARLS